MFRADDGHIVAKTEHPSIELLADSHGNAYLKMLLIHRDDKHILAELVYHGVHHIHSEHHRYGFNPSVEHTERGFLKPQLLLPVILKELLAFSVQKHNFNACHSINAIGKSSLPFGVIGHKVIIIVGIDQIVRTQLIISTLFAVPQIEKVEERCFIAIQALHAMRPCEVLGLKWEDIDLNKGVIHIRWNVVHPKRNRPVVGDTKTKLSKRVLTISQIALPYIQEAERRAGKRSDFVFGGREPLSYTQHRQMMYRISNQMNIKGITGYTFRHTVITDIYETTRDANIASAVAGHSKTSITMNRYSHTRQDAIRKGIGALDKTYNL